jgi:hypothetical protein
MVNVLLDLHKNDEHLDIKSNIENMECISFPENEKSKEKALKHILHVDEKLPNRL